MRAIVLCIRTRNCLKPRARSNSSARSTIRSFSRVMVSPYTKRDARQANDGLSKTGRPDSSDSFRISALVSCASLSGLRIFSSSIALSPGR